MYSNQSNSGAFKQGARRNSDGIQPHGTLLVLNPCDATITTVSDNIQQILGTPPPQVLGQPLDVAFGPDLCQGVFAALTCFRANAPAGPAGLEWQQEKDGRLFIGHVHEQYNRIILELEPALADKTPRTISLASLMADLKCVSTEANLLAKSRATAALIRRFTGYDRVVICRFDAHGNSELLAEAHAADLEALSGWLDSIASLHGHQPGKGGQLIVDTHAVASGLLTIEPDAPPPDLSRCILENAPRAQCSRLRALNIRTCLQSPLLDHGTPWGLILCLHRTPRPEAQATRELLTWLGNDLAAQFNAIESSTRAETDLFGGNNELRILRHCVSHMSEGLILTSEDGSVVSVNESAIRLLGLTLSQWNTPGSSVPVIASINQNDGFIVQHAPPFRLGIKDMLKKKAQEHRLQLAGEDPRWIRLFTTAFPTANRSCASHVMISIQEITSKRFLQRKLSQMAKTDPLTGLFNRSHFHEQLVKVLARAENSGQMIRVMLLDLDHFKYINDSMGHGIGDHLLCNVAQRLKAAVREDDFIARLGGDEFVIFTSPSHSQHLILTFAQRISKELKQPFRMGKAEYNTSASIGLALFPRDGQTAEELLRQADIAMYAAKRKNVGEVQIYTEELGYSLQKQIAGQARLKQAQELQQFELFYQPKVDVASGEITGLEALIRWRDQEGCLIMPDSFIPLAENIGLIDPIGNWVLEQAAKDLHRLEQLGLGHLSIAVNLSGRQFQKPGLAGQIQALLVEYGIVPSRFQVEITETLLMEDNALTMQNLDQLSTMGITVCIDDFGTGYSSLAYLRRFQVGTLKIDRSFITCIIDDYDQLKITDAIIKMAKSLDLHTVAEGVECQSDLDVLKKLKCDTYQGYFFSHPAPLQELLQGCLRQSLSGPWPVLKNSAGQPIGSDKPADRT